MEGSFSFKNSNIRETQLDDCILLRIERVGFAIARVYVVDDSFAEIDVPEGLVIYDNTNNANVVRFANRQEFLLAWSDSYSIKLNDVLILELNTQRQWSLRSVSERAIRTVEN